MNRIIYKNIIEEQIFVTTEDGVSLALLIKRPNSNEKFPVLMTYTPYRVSTGLGGVDLLEFAKYGYATVIFDVRGTGDSSGISDSVYSDGERSDGLFMINWASKQSWSDGKVGLWGISYGAIIALQMAAKAPLALKAIIARSGSDDPFAEWTNIGGTPRNYIYESYSPFMSARNFAPPSATLWGKKWREIWRERLEGNTPWGISFLNEIEDSQFWRNRAARGELDQIICPVFVVEGWSDWYSNPMLRIFAQLKGEKRALIGPWGHQWPNNALPGPRIDWHSEALRWWDRWLKDEDIDLGAPLTIYVEKYRKPSNFIRDSPGYFITGSQWPIEDSKEQTYSLNLNEMSLDRNEKDLQSQELKSKISIPYSPKAGTFSGKVGGGPFRYNVLKPLDQNLESERSITLLGAITEEKVIIVGNPRARIYLSSDSDIGQLSVSLIDQAPDGLQSLLSRGFINISYAGYPSQTPAALTPEKIYQVDLELVALAYQLDPRHRIGIKIGSADFQMSWPAAHPFVLTLHSSAKYPSTITIPYLSLPANDDGATIKVLVGGEAPELPAVSYRLTEDLINSEIGYQFESKSVFANAGQLKVNSIEPGYAEITARSIYTEENGSHQIRIEADCTTASDPLEIWHQVEIVATVNGDEYFRKSFSTKRSRRVF
ncbi:MAG: CocE/NonD family hydrolase [Candidatus Planktophila sp.]|nr:CocE/NonD family hydrolase [Candidatus Planktophila sp.]